MGCGVDVGSSDRVNYFSAAELKAHDCKADTAAPFTIYRTQRGSFSSLISQCLVFSLLQYLYTRT